jgi:2-dehydro-3-deoxyphosphogluconate aldolase/(4S)-4-hydroxy-2-oxoglutarate aldolase
MAIVTPDRESTLDELVRGRLVAVLRFDEPGACLAAAEAAAAGGLTALEVTLTTPDALAAIVDLSRRSNLCVGVGSVRTREDLERAADAGARFMASPTTERDVVARAHEFGLIAMPGALTPTEIDRAWRGGADIVKLFPVPADGALYIRSVLGPMPEVRLAPSGGVTPETARAFLAAGACALNVGSWLTHRDGRPLAPIVVRERAELLVAAVHGSVV